MTTQTCRTRYAHNHAIACTLDRGHTGEHEDHVFDAPNILVFSDHPWPAYLPTLREISRLGPTAHRRTKVRRRAARREPAGTGPQNRRPAVALCPHRG